MSDSFDIGPWDQWRVHGQYDFVDRNARWLWSHEDGATYTGWPPDPMTNKEFRFYTYIEVPEETAVVFHTIIDNVASIELNGVKIPCPSNSSFASLCKDSVFGGGWTSGSNYIKIPLTLKKGENLIDVKAMNTGGPGGFIASVIASDGKVLSSSNPTGWKYEAGGGTVYSWVTKDPAKPFDTAPQETRIAEVTQQKESRNFMTDDTMISGISNWILLAVCVCLLVMSLSGALMMSQQSGGMF